MLTLLEVCHSITADRICRVIRPVPACPGMCEMRAVDRRSTRALGSDTTPRATAWDGVIIDPLTASTIIQVCSYMGETELSEFTNLPLGIAIKMALSDASTTAGTAHAVSAGMAAQFSTP